MKTLPIGGKLESTLAHSLATRMCDFDLTFSTSGSMRSHFGSVDFTAAPGDEVIDNSPLALQDDNFNLVAVRKHCRT